MKPLVILCLACAGMALATPLPAMDTQYEPVRAVIQMCAACPAKRWPQLRLLRDSVTKGEYGQQVSIQYVRAEKPLLLVYGPYDYLLGRFNINEEPLEKLHYNMEIFGFKRASSASGKQQSSGSNSINKANGQSTTPWTASAVLPAIEGDLAEFIEDIPGK